MRDQRDPQELGLQIFQTRDLCKVSILEAADLVDIEFNNQALGVNPPQVGCLIPAVDRARSTPPGPWPEGSPRRLFEEDGA